MPRLTLCLRCRLRLRLPPQARLDIRNWGVSLFEGGFFVVLREARRNPTVSGKKDTPVGNIYAANIKFIRKTQLACLSQSNTECLRGN